MTRFRHFSLAVLLAAALALVVLSACQAEPQNAAAPPATAQPTRSGRLTPLASATVTITPTPEDPSTPTPLPTATPTPRTHVVKQGEDMGGIAWLYRVSLEDLMAANPTVQPNMMSIGTQLIIPYSETPVPSGGAAQSTPSTITPIPAEAARVTCWRTEENGAWCFQPVRNNQGEPLESLSAVFRMIDRSTDAVVTQAAYLPLDVLPPDRSLPLVAYFPPPVPQSFDVHSEPRSALPSPDDGRYLPAQVDNAQVMIDESGHSAVIRLEAALDTAGSTAQRLWVAAVAYDSRQNVVGVRRWENEEGQIIQSGQALPLEIQVYSLGGPIERVELLAEARP